MKRNRTNVRSTRRSKTGRGGKSKYRAKVERGEQMYGPGCCAHKIRSRIQDLTPRQIREET